MKKALKLKAFMLSMVIGFALLPMNMFAQSSDDFFCVDDAFNGNRDVVAWNITNNGIGQSEAPVGSGLLILGAIGAGYAIAKRKRNKKGAALLLALALTLGFTQCKKKVVEPISSVTGGTTYHISIPAGDGSKVVVNPVGGGTYATVGFEDGDVIYVGYNNAYVGTITYNSAAGKKCFEGDITTSIVGEQPLHLYLLGGKGFTVNRDENIATVVISDQSSKYPVVSYSPTTTNFTGSGSYEATLHNKCSIMKFIVATGTNYANDPIRMTGMHNKVTVNFATPNASENGFSYSVNSTDGGLIKMPTIVANVTWAIVLPQDALAEGTEGSTYTNGYKGKRPEIAAIARNTYYDAGIDLDLTTEDASKIKDLSTVSENWTAEDGWTLTGTLDVEHYPVKISIADGATVTLNNVNINGVNNDSYEWAGLNCLGDATIVLKDGTTNTVRGFYENYPGIYVPENKTVTIQGTGSLTASSNGHGAGIGGGYRLACGNIEIQGGVITATSNNSVAGIGSGFQGSCGNITISGGNITANGGGNNTAGIGTGAQGTCGNITISGGSITANGGGTGAGIGTGAGGTCLNITINNTVTSVTATKGTGAPNSIGAGDYGTCGTVTIGGTIYWDGSAYQNGGDTYLPTSPLVYPTPAPSVTDLATITENYTASDGEILTGKLGTNVKISIAAGATVTLDNADINGDATWKTGNYAGLSCLGDATIILKDGTTNTVKGFYENYPGIQAAHNTGSGDEYTLTIQGTGSLTASSNGWGAGIGGGYQIPCGNIVINGGSSIEATGGHAAGIGGGQSANCGDITISGGNITANGGESGAGIGTGNNGTCGNITISGGSITANGGSYAAGIGTGFNGNCGSITIYNTVTSVWASKGTDATNSIGTGYGESCGTVTIGGTVYWGPTAADPSKYEYKNGGDTYLPTSPLVYPAP